MNEYEIDDAVAEYEQVKDQVPNLHAAAVMLSRLRGWTNSRSDGWQYWSKPSAAAAHLIGLIVDARREYRRTWELVDVTEAQLKKALTPVKSFLTRQEADWRDVLEKPAPDPLRELMRRVWNEGFAADAGATNPYA